MLIREAIEADIPGIVSVLKMSLGEKELAITEKIWRYKHIDNPFGKSVVLVAEQSDQIIGVRALMRWQWQWGNKVFSALRAVDTATHPDHQGKGIFKRLTLAAVDVVKNSGDHFIFNTPNDQSRPGYLKMGWKPVGKIEIGIRPSWTFLFHDQEYNLPSSHKALGEESIQHLCSNWNEKLKSNSGCFTPKSAKFLEWRYENNPLLKYSIFSSEFFYAALYIKRRGKFRELRVSELILSDGLNRKERKNFLKKIEKEFSAHLISFTPKMMSSFGKKGYYGPLLVLNDLNLNREEAKKFNDITNWYNSIGDLELF